MRSGSGLLVCLSVKEFGAMIWIDGLELDEREFQSAKLKLKSSPLKMKCASERKGVSGNFRQGQVPCSQVFWWDVGELTCG